MAELTDGYHDLPPQKIAALVTLLEMHEPPPQRPVDPPPGVTLERPEPIDLDRYLALYRRIGLDWLWFSRLRLSRDDLAAILTDPAVELWYLRRGCDDLGLLELDRRHHPDVELAFFGLAPDLVGTTAGRFLMNHAIQRAFAPGPCRFWVHTCSLDHPKALAFYVRSGFTPYARALEIADDPRLTGDLPADAAPWLPLVEVCT
ncbi:MAG: GNAT family N-acetyltransferase [Geminicoccaceae bacterium]